MKTRDNAGDRRRAKADKTRRELVKAARRILMSRQGLAGFNLEAVARRARVTRLTIYNQFGSRLGLLEAVYDDLASRGKLAEHMADAFRRTSPEACLDGVVAAFVEFWNSQRTLLRRLRSMAVLDPAFAGARQRDERRRAAMRAVAARWAAQSGRAPADQETIVNVLTALTGFEVFDALAGKQADPETIKTTIGALARAALARNGRRDAAQP